jgi:hypothetical protein
MTYEVPVLSFVGSATDIVLGGGPFEIVDNHIDRVGPDDPNDELRTEVESGAF